VPPDAVATDGASARAAVVQAAYEILTKLYPSEAGDLSVQRTPRLRALPTAPRPLRKASLFPTPNHPEYPSGHSCLSGASAQILSRYFGEHSEFDVVTDRPVDSNGDAVKQHYLSFSDALGAVVEARVFAVFAFARPAKWGRGSAVKSLNSC
jgi:hypothetical protein